MPKRQLIYLDDMVLTFLSGAKEFRGSKREAAALVALRVAVLCGEVTLVASFVQKLSRVNYRHRGKRGAMRAVAAVATINVGRSKRLDRLTREVSKTGLGRIDAAHVAAARVARAVLLTLDKQMLHLARQYPAMFGVVYKPSEWVKKHHADEEE